MSYNSVERINFISQTQASKNHIILFSLNHLNHFWGQFNLSYWGFLSCAKLYKFPSFCEILEHDRISSTCRSPLIISEMSMVAVCMAPSDLSTLLLGDGREILSCAPHSFPCLATVTSLEHWPRLSRWLYLSYLFLISGPSFSSLLRPSEEGIFSLPCLAHLR